MGRRLVLGSGHPKARRHLSCRASPPFPLHPSAALKEADPFLLLRRNEEQSYGSVTLLE